MAKTKNGADTAADAAAADTRQAYTVVSPLEHDQVQYAPGSDVLLTPEQATPLLGHTVKRKDAAEESSGE